MQITKTFISILLLANNFGGPVNTVRGEKILAVLFIATKSHKNVFDPLLEELAKRNHQVTVISGMKPNKNITNLRDITGANIMVGNNTMPNKFEARLKNEKPNPFLMVEVISKTCRTYYEQPEVKELAKKEKFDLVITNAFMNECTYGLIHHFNTSYIFLSPAAVTGWIPGFVGSPQPPSFIPFSMLGLPEKMNFFERVKNFVGLSTFTVLRNYYFAAHMQALYQEYYPNAPSALDFDKNVDLILANGHFSISHPRPTMPDLIDVGGMHCRPSEPLPKDLDDFLTGSGKEGFIYFSMGSIIQGSTMPDYMMKAFINTFSKLKQRVLWKWETETMEGLPPNVKLGKWLPQQDVLGHQNIKLFITHGGLLSTQEAVYHGVPLIGIPMMGDQDLNMRQAENSGYALTLELKDITEQYLTSLINRILNEPPFMDRARTVSKIFRDQPDKPLDRAVYWTEYVMRHKGAKHLRSAARDLNIFQYHSIDVIATIAAVLLAILFLFIKTVKFIRRKICGSTKRNDVQSKSRLKKD